MKRVTGIGKIFFKPRDPDRLRQWYREPIGINAYEHGAMFEWRDKDQPQSVGQTVWSSFYLTPSTSSQVPQRLSIRLPTRMVYLRN